MRIEHVCHASLLIDAGERRIATDPWWAGPAYEGQWHVFPRPVAEARAEAADTVVLSHGHEDHLHFDTLRRFSPDTRIVYPHHWSPGTPGAIAEAGFVDLEEPRPGKTVDLGGGCKLTFVLNGHDAIMVFERDGYVCININDALHSAEPEQIDAFVHLLRRRWGQPQAVFCGFGGASYFPNTFHAPDKDDLAVATLREELFVHRFCRIVAGLEPEVAVPFAADFTLLAPTQRWISRAQFPREQIAAYYEQHFGRQGRRRPRIQPMYPGDVLEEGQLVEASPYRRQLRAGSLDHLVTEQYPEVRSAFDKPASVDTEALARRFSAHLAEQASAKDAPSFNVELADRSSEWLHVDPSLARVKRAPGPRRTDVARLSMSSGALEASLSWAWGGDALVIGYGVESRAPSRALLPQARRCAELCVLHPSALTVALGSPGRALRLLPRSASGSRARLEARIRRTVRRAGNTVSGSFWLTATPSQIRELAGLPRAERDRPWRAPRAAFASVGG